MAIRSLSELIVEARRRRVFRVAAIYIVGAWVFLQVAENAFPAFDIPESAIRYVYLGALLAFPIAIIFGWRYDMVGGRIVRTQTVAEDVELSLQRPDYVILASLVVVATVIAIGLGGEILEQQTPVADLDWVDSADPASIAVLPFANMSSDPENSYFADGIAEELLNGLAKIAGLQVRARTSSFSLRDKNLEMRQIGQKLNVAFVLEGSVRVAGDRLRITAQLIDSRNDTHRWSETYDQAMNDIFAVQEEIATNVVAAMKNTLTLADATVDPIWTTRNSEAYGHYLRARALVRNLSYDDEEIAKIEAAINYLKTAVELDPAFSDGHVALADAYFALGSVHFHNYRPVATEKAITSAKEAARRALELAPRSSEALLAWGMIVDDPEQQEKAIRDAIEANPNNVAAYRYLLNLMIEKRDFEESLALARNYHLLDPLSAESSDLLAYTLVMDGGLKEASDYFRLASQLRSGVVGEDVKPSEGYLEYIAGLSTKPLELDLERHLHMRIQGQCSSDYELSISSDAYTGDQSAYLAAKPDAQGWCNTVGGARAASYRGKYIRLVGMIKTRNAVEGANLWMRIDGPTLFFSLGFDNGELGDIDTPDIDWHPYELNLYVPHDAYVIFYGGVLNGGGEMWMDDFRFEASDNADFN